MLTRSHRVFSSCSALVAGLALFPASNLMAQEADLPPGRARSTNERIETEVARPLSATGEASRIEAQQRPGVSQNMGGRDVTMLVEHAVGMAIEGSSLQAIAGPASASSDDSEPVKRLRNKARKLLSESQTLLGQAAADSRGMAANPAVGRFHSAANLYITTLAGLEPSNPGENAQITLINQSVKDVLDADHIRQMSPNASGSAPIEQLKTHAAAMKVQGMDMIRGMTAEGTSTGQNPVNVTTLATRARQLLEAADEVSRSHAVPSASTTPGSFSGTRPEIIGGTYGTGSPGTGTYTNAGRAPGSTLPKTQGEPSPIPNNSNETTGSTGGTKPR